MKTENRKMRQDNGKQLKEIHLRLDSQLLRKLKIATAFDEETLAVWVSDAIQKKLENYPFVHGL